MRLATIALLALFGAGCLDGESGADASAAVDMRLPADFSGVDFLGVYNCSQLNACEQLCKNLMCVAACRQMGSPSAVTKEVALQKCFNQLCPQASDMASPICAADPVTGARSAACMTCINNTLKAATTDCTPVTAPECKMCFNQAQDCNAD